MLSCIELNVDMLFNEKKKLILFKIQVLKIGNDGFAAHEKNGIRHSRTGKLRFLLRLYCDGMQFNPNT